MSKELNLVIPVQTSEYGRRRKTKRPPFLQMSALIRNRAGNEFPVTINLNSFKQLKGSVFHYQVFQSLPKSNLPHTKLKVLSDLLRQQNFTIPKSS